MYVSVYTCIYIFFSREYTSAKGSPSRTALRSCGEESWAAADALCEARELVFTMQGAPKVVERETEEWGASFFLFVLIT